MKAIVLAYHNIGCVGIEALLRHGFEIAAVFTHPDDPAEAVWFRSVAECAAAHRIPVYAPKDLHHPMWIRKIEEAKPDILFSFYYRKLVGESILKIPPAGCLNLHGSLLPRYRGRAPVNWAVIRGETETGVTLHYMTPRPDDGDIVWQTPAPIFPEDTAKSLHERLAETAATLLDEALPRLKAGTAPRRPQDESRATYFGGRRPADGEIDWSMPAAAVRNLVRGVTRPYPGAFSYSRNRKCTFWRVTEFATGTMSAAPGSVLSLRPLVIQCGAGAVQVDLGQADGSVTTAGEQLAAELGLVHGMKFGPSITRKLEAARKKKVLILGVDGFIGNALSERLLESGKYDVAGMDIHSQYVQRFLGHPGFEFSVGDISIHREWIEYHIGTADVVVPLVAIATPIEYTRNPLRVFELDFEENLRVVRYCVKYKKTLVFPSTSEVYGMCEEPEFDEERSKLVLGPIRMQRWIYSCSKQLLDRVIWAYGQQEGLKFTLFRPFNWIGSRLDSLAAARIGSSRVITQLILNLVEGSPIQLVDGGAQKRCFTDVSDGIECLYRIIENRDGVCDRKIINIGNPDNEFSIRELAEMLVQKFEEHPLRWKFPPFAGMREIESGSYYGAGYQDLQHRRPSIRNARRLLQWTPKVGLPEAVERTLDFFLREAVRSEEFVTASEPGS